MNRLPGERYTVKTKSRLNQKKKKDSHNLTKIYIKMILYNLGLNYGFIFIDYTPENFPSKCKPLTSWCNLKDLILNEL